MMLLAACGPTPDSDDGWSNPTPPRLADEDPSEGAFRATLTARRAAWAYRPDRIVTGLAYEGTVPGPLLRVTQGDSVTIDFHNELPSDFPTTVHWHGIEGSNAADGTPVTQGMIEPGGSFLYEMTTPRAGQYWYHPHERGAQGVFEGLYAPLIVDDPAEEALRAQGVLPTRELILVFSDLSEYQGLPWSVEVDNATEIMNGTEGEHLLVNGREDPTFDLAPNEPVRLRLFNTSITRFWNVAVPGHTLYRIGGQGGLLDAVRVEGGTVDARGTGADGADLGIEAIDLGYERGTILLGPAERADVVLVPTGPAGSTLDLVWHDVARGRHGMWMDGDTMVMGELADDGARPSETVATFALGGPEGSGWTLDEGHPVRTGAGPATEVLDPTLAVPWTGTDAMVLSETMDMWLDDDGVWQMATELMIDGDSWHGDHDHPGPDQAYAPTARFAQLGETLFWEVRNESHMSHPIHLHGFSYQVVSWQKIDDDSGQTWAWDQGWTEFVDTSIVPGRTSMFLLVRLDDPRGDESAAGRWMRHCHILQHGENGMMSELVVQP